MDKYRQTVDAVQFHYDAENWPEGVGLNREQDPRVNRDGSRVWCATIVTLEKVHVIRDGQWIVRDSAGQIEVYTDDRFHRTYTPVQE